MTTAPAPGVLEHLSPAAADALVTGAPLDDVLTPADEALLEDAPHG